MRGTGRIGANDLSNCPRGIVSNDCIRIANGAGQGNKLTRSSPAETKRLGNHGALGCVPGFGQHTQNLLFVHNRVFVKSDFGGPSSGPFNKR